MQDADRHSRPLGAARLASSAMTRLSDIWSQPPTLGDSVELYAVYRNSPQHSSTCRPGQHAHGNVPRGGDDTDDANMVSWTNEPREGILTKRRERRLAQRLSKPAYVNTDACCREDRAGLAYESATLGNRTELVLCTDSTLAEHLALLMAMRDAESRLPGHVVFRVDSTAVVGPIRDSAHPVLVVIKRQITELLGRHQEWELLLIDKVGNLPAHHLASRPLRCNV
jgi:hypothetical protein